MSDHTPTEFGTRTDPHAQARTARDQPLLLHSMALFREVFALAFAHRRIDTVVEVGVETGQVSALYTELGAHTVYCVEPAPTPQMRTALDERDELHLVEAASPGALAHLPPADLYVLDGDHNYATVRAELDWILTHAPEALVACHDVLWPSARRDQYYEPTGLNADQRHPSSDDGPTVWHDALTSSGFVGDGSYSSATAAGGAGNGVLTAIEDAMAESGDRELAVIPAVFGLGLVLRSESTADSGLRTALQPYTSSTLLAELENNRIALYTRVLAMQAEAAAHADESDRMVRDLADKDAEIGALRRDCERLRQRHAQETAELQRRNADLAEQVEQQRRPGSALRNLAGLGRDTVRRAVWR